MNNIKLLDWLSEEEYNIVHSRCKYYGMGASVAFDISVVTNETIYIAAQTSKDHSREYLNFVLEEFFRDINTHDKSIVNLYHYYSPNKQFNIEASEKELKEYFLGIDYFTIIKHLNQYITDDFEFQKSLLNFTKYELIKRFKNTNDQANLDSIKKKTKITSFLTSLFKLSSLTDSDQLYSEILF